MPESAFNEISLVNDYWIAERIGMKHTTIRSQRFKRLHSLKHWLTVDPVYVGNKPRYRMSDVLAWLSNNLEAAH